MIDSNYINERDNDEVYTLLIFNTVILIDLLQENSNLKYLKCYKRLSEEFEYLKNNIFSYISLIHIILHIIFFICYFLKSHKDLIKEFDKVIIKKQNSLNKKTDIIMK